MTHDYRRFTTFLPTSTDVAQTEPFKAATATQLAWLQVINFLISSIHQLQNTQHISDGPVMWFDQ